MPELNDSTYYAARAEKARACADAAVDTAIGAIHREMAVKYEELVEHLALTESRAA